MNFNFTEKELDTAFIGQWAMHHVDDYGCIKQGTHSRALVVRSKVDSQRGVVALISHVPDNNGVTNIYMDGTTGFYGKITERTASYKADELVRMDFLHLKLIDRHSVSKDFSIQGDYKVWKTVAEIDDVVYNQNNEYSYPAYYFATNTVCPKLVGLYIEIPIKDFNHYVHMRDLWLRDYKGASIIG